MKQKGNHNISVDKLQENWVTLYIWQGDWFTFTIICSLHELFSLENDFLYCIKCIYPMNEMYIIQLLDTRILHAYM